MPAERDQFEALQSQLAEFTSVPNTRSQGIDSNIKDLYNMMEQLELERNREKKDNESSVLSPEKKKKKKKKDPSSDGSPGGKA